MRLLFPIGHEIHPYGRQTVFVKNKYLTDIYESKWSSGQSSPLFLQFLSMFNNIYALTPSLKMLFAVTGRKWKDRKHLMLGMAMKKLTSCRRVIEILNRVGYSVSYSTVEELVTEWTLQYGKSQATPFGMELKS